jgi:hypothetical protein
MKLNFVLNHKVTVTLRLRTSSLLFSSPSLLFPLFPPLSVHFSPSSSLLYTKQAAVQFPKLWCVFGGVFWGLSLFFTLISWPTWPLNMTIYVAMVVHQEK